MTNAWKQIHPKDSFVAKLATPITSYDEKVLSYLYQPMIGMDAFGLYHMLLTLVDQNDYDSHEILHSDIMAQLSIGVPRFFDGRVRLEGIGLLRVFTKTTRDDRNFIYELQKPLTANQIFKDDVLSLILLDKVGERRFDKLVAEFEIPTVDRVAYTETTKKFLDVYGFNQDMLQSYQNKLDEVKNKFPETEPPSFKVEDKSFDWAYFMSLLEGLYINKEQVEAELKDTVYTLHQMYGLNELDMKKLVEQEIDYSTNEVDIKKLRQRVVKKFHGTKQRSQPNYDNPDLTEDENLLRRENTLTLQGFAEGEIQVILASESIAPMIFLQAIKKQKGGFVGNEERWIVENLMKQSGLPDGVINVLIHYVLVVKGNASLTTNFVNAIANSWGQDKIFSPEDAMKKVKELQGAQIKKNYTKKTNYKNKNQGSMRKESLPDWVDKKNTETLVSKEEEAYFKEQLRLLRNDGKEGES